MSQKQTHPFGRQQGTTVLIGISRKGGFYGSSETRYIMKWISVKEHLPEENGQYLVFAPFVGQSKHIAWYNKYT